MDYLTLREIRLEDCPWLTNPIPAGTRLHRCTQNTFEYDTEHTAAVTLNPNGNYPFYAVPRDALTALTHTQAA